MRAVALLLLLTLSAVGVARAETVRVRSGEHPGFSRLVFDFEEPTGWEMAPTDTGYTLSVSRRDVTFDLSGVYRLIPRDRLSDISAGPGAVFLTVGCECYAKAFEIRPGRLVLDILDGVDPAAPAAEQAQTAGLMADVPTEAEARPAMRASAAMAEVLGRPPAMIFGTLPELPATAPASPEMPAPESGPPDVQAVAQAREVQRMLLQELSRAAAQGLVQADVAPPPAPPEISASEGPPPRAAAPPKMPPATPVPAYPGIRIETSVDRANAALPRPALTDKGAPCLPDRLFDLPAWGAELPPQTLIGTARSALVGEFDKVGEAELRRLVRAYLYLGFGAEAKSVMGGFGISLADAGPLFALAEIIDDGAAADPAIFAGQIGCDAPVALWAALSAPDLPSGREINRGAIIASFSALPLHLRRHLGPGLARRFLDFGDRETASRIRNAVTRAAGDHGSGLALTQARLDIAGGNLAAAGPLLDEIVSRDDSASPDALLVLLETRIGADEPPSPGDLLTAQALAFERQGTEQGARLARAAVLGTALNGDFDLAFADMERLPDAVAAPLRDELVELLVRRGSDAAFLRHLFAGAGTVTLPGATAIPAARRMLALGFPEAARALLAQHLDDSPEVRLLRAEIALRSGDAASALAGLRGLPGAAAEQLRAEAQLLLGDLTAARAHLAAAGSAGRLGNLAWRAGDWETVARLGTDARKRLAESRMRPGPAEADSAGSETNLPPTLAKARALVEQGAETRSLVRDLLAEAR